MEKVKVIDSKVGKMITVVMVAFSLLTITFIIARMTMDTGLIGKKIITEQQLIGEKIQKEINSKQEEKLDKMINQTMLEFKKLDARITELHKDDKR